MYTQERTPMAELIVGGPVPLNSYDNAIVAALIENRPVMLIHAFNGGYLKPVDLSESSHDQGARIATTLDPATRDQYGHLWYITPGGYFGQRPLYFIESAAGEAHNDQGDQGATDSTARGDDGIPKPKRRRITVHQDAPESNADAIQVGLPSEVDVKWRGKNGAYEDTQLWIVTVTPWGGITFVPITHPDAILGVRGNTIVPHSEVCVTYNWGGDFTGTVINTFYPRLPNEWGVPYHHIFT
jgi:hypothetical protein